METTEKTKQGYFKVADDVWGLKDIFVNVYLVANPDKSWVLVDAGLKTSFPKIKQAAAALFGADVPPAAIVLTHGHFDHVGSLEAIIQEWNVPVYAHFLEMPYLTGKSDYPPADPSVGGGLMSWMSGLYPNDAIDLIDAVKSLPFDEHIPALPEWRYYHTPGHSPGHISLWREKDRLLLAGDAFVTTKQESAWCVLTQRKVLSGPPKYFTCNWYDSEKSVNMLAELQPETVATGHGKPMSGQEMKQQLMELAYNFPEKAVPAYGRYVAEPAVANQHGVVSLPKDRTRPERTLKLIGGLALALAGCIIFPRQKAKERRYGPDAPALLERFFTKAAEIFSFTSINSLMELSTNKSHEEGGLATAIEEQTAKLPSDVFLWTSIASMGVSLAFKLSGHKHTALFIGQWAAPFLLLGIYNKIVKTQGHD